MSLFSVMDIVLVIENFGNNKVGEGRIYKFFVWFFEMDYLFFVCDVFGF